MSGQRNGLAVSLVGAQRRAGYRRVASMDNKCIMARDHWVGHRKRDGLDDQHRGRYVRGMESRLAPRAASRTRNRLVLPMANPRFRLVAGVFVPSGVRTPAQRCEADVLALRLMDPQTWPGSGGGHVGLAGGKRA